MMHGDVPWQARSVPAVFDHPRRRTRGNRGHARRRRSSHIEHLHFGPPSDSGHAPTRSFGVVFRYPMRLDVRGLAGQVSFPSGCPTALVGFIPSQVYSRRRVANASLRCRAHMPFLPFRPPRFIFVEVTRPPVWNAISEKRKGDKVWDDLGSASGLRLPSAIRFATQPALRIDPALGFASFRVVGTRFVHSDGLDPVRIISPRAPITRRPIRSWVLAPVGSNELSAADNSHSIVAAIFIPPHRRPFSVLKRPMPCRSDRLRDRSNRLPV